MHGSLIALPNKSNGIEIGREMGEKLNTDRAIYGLGVIGKLLKVYTTDMCLHLSSTVRLGEWRIATLTKFEIEL